MRSSRRRLNAARRTGPPKRTAAHALRQPWDGAAALSCQTVRTRRATTQSIIHAANCWAMAAAANMRPVTWNGSGERKPPAMVDTDCMPTWKNRMNGLANSTGAACTAVIASSRETSHMNVAHGNAARDTTAQKARPVACRASRQNDDANIPAARPTKSALISATPSSATWPKVTPPSSTGIASTGSTPIRQ